MARDLTRAGPGHLKTTVKTTKANKRNDLMAYCNNLIKLTFHYFTSPIKKCVRAYEE